jgi:hypothetical protein
VQAKRMGGTCVVQARLEHEELGAALRHQTAVLWVGWGRFQRWPSATTDFTLFVLGPFRSRSRLPARSGEGGELEHNDRVVEFHRVGHADRTSA